VLAAALWVGPLRFMRILHQLTSLLVATIHFVFSVLRARESKSVIDRGRVESRMSV